MAKKPPEEDALWQALAAEVHPIKAKSVVERKTPPRYKRTTAPTQLVAPMGDAPAWSVAAGDLTAMDGKNALRLKRGEYEIDGTLDLHGQTVVQAEASLKRFIGSHFARQSRCVLIITGKGNATGGGVLKAQFSHFLNLPEVRPMVVAAHAAQAKHGGGGAYYVLLKRKRGEA